MKHKPGTTETFSQEQKNRFAAGRRRYHALQQAMAEIRRAELIRLLRTADLSVRGWQSRLAENLGVHRSVVSRDLKQIRNDSKKQKLSELERKIDRQFQFAELLQRSLHGAESDADPDPET